jgi:hemolysin activation/secretion protein
MIALQTLSPNTQHRLQAAPMKHRPPVVRLSLLALALSGASSVLAASAPDAGRTLQENAPTLEAPRVSPGIDLQAPIPAVGEAGGATLLLQSVSFSGNSLYDADTLRGVLGPVAGQQYDLAGLRGLTNRISSFYRANGYPFARAYIPAQTMEDGLLEIGVIEGRYGQVQASGEADLASGAQNFLQALEPGAVIESRSLERTVLILDDLPGIKAMPIVRPGLDAGTGDLAVQVEREPLVTGSLGLDNHGNRFTGSGRARFDLDINGALLFGDQISLGGLYTEEQMWFGSVGYSLPLGSSGLRGNLGYTQTYYELGKEFASLDASGTAKVSNLGLSYPLIRSQKANLTLAADWLHKRLEDEQASTDSRDQKSSDSLPLSLRFDLRDGFGGGGISYGAVSWTHGELELSDELEAVDRNSAKTAGSFDKFNVDLARLQALPASFSLYARVAAQWAADNLDSSEGFGLGGADGVRAYPSGEGFGDEGWLTQVELRYAVGAFTPYAFYDSGRVRINHQTFAAGDNHRSLSGTGLGLRFDQQRWSADASLAWRTQGGAAESDNRDDTPRLWLEASYKL